MNLYVLRHGLAADRDSLQYSRDEERPLTPKGTRKMARQVKGMRSIGLSMDAIVTSPLLRAVQTARIVHKRLPALSTPVTSESLTPLGDPHSLMDELATGYPSDSSVMIVGHEPYLSDLISVLVSGVPGQLVRLKKGALCKLRLPSPRYARCGWIEWSLTPRQLVRLG
jgi:phosphohistidine phosphatase